MERHSVSRRASLNLGSPPPTRSRSAERSMRQLGETLVVDTENIEQQRSGICEAPSFDSKSSHDNNIMPDSTRSIRPERAMSDPFDTADAQGIVEEAVKDFGDLDDEEHAIPTLPRFPFLETNNKNCWSESPIQIFSVRGSDYLTAKKKLKVPCQKYLLSARGCDLFLSDNPSSCDTSKLHGALGGKLRHYPSLLIRLTFPWGMLIQYYEVSAKFLPFLRGDKTSSMDSFTVQEKTLAKWLIEDAKYRTDRLKLIPNVAEGPWIVRNLVTGTPTIIGKKLPVTYKYVSRDGHHQDFLEVNLDVANSVKAAQKIVSVCRRYMTALTVDIGFVIEGTTEDELPEEMMGAIRIHHLDSVKAPTIHEH